jgi:hypothetical protein
MALGNKLFERHAKSCRLTQGSNRLSPNIIPKYVKKIRQSQVKKKDLAGTWTWVSVHKECVRVRKKIRNDEGIRTRRRRRP